MPGEIKYHPKAIAEAFGSARYYNRQQEGLGAEFFDALDGWRCPNATRSAAAETRREWSS